ncbi:MAG: oxidoreductase [Rhodoglobus sp.]|nr:oxidoreductase [Rhodoglobus sp.]
MAPIRTAIIGYGLAGQVFHEPLVASNPAYSLDLVVTSNPERQAKAAQKYEVVATTEELLARSRDLDLVIIATPPPTHFEQARAVLEAGIALVVDKPFVVTTAEAETLIDISERQGVPLSVFQSRRWDGDFLTVKALVEQGAFGRIHRFESSFERWSVELRAEWQGATPVNEGGGVTFDVGSHLVDQALHLFGPATLEYAEVGYVRDGRASDDESFLALHHESGVRSHITVARVSGQPGARFRVLGENNAYASYGLDGQEAGLKEGIWPDDPNYGVTPPALWGTLGVDDSEGVTSVPTERGRYPEFYVRMAAAILEGSPVPVAPRDAVASLAILERAHEISAR